METQKVISFTCTKCQEEFDPPHGGICDICKKPFCDFHLKIYRQNGQIIPVCVDCCKNGDGEREN